MTTASLTRPRVLFAPGAARRGFLLGFGATLTVGIFLLLGLAVGLGVAFEGRALPNVWVGSESIAGLGREQAMARLAERLPSAAGGSAALRVDGSPLDVSYQALAREYDLELMVDEALAVGHSGNPLADGLSRLRSLLQPTEIAVSLRSADPAAIDRVAEQIVHQLWRRPVSAGVAFDPERGYVVKSASVGSTIDLAEVRAALTELATRTDADELALSIGSRQINPVVSTRDAGAAAVAARWMTRDPLTMTSRRDAVVLEPETLRTFIGFGVIGESYGPIVREAALREWLEGLAPELSTRPRDAGFRWGATGIAAVTPAVLGRELDVERSVETIASVLAARGRGAAALSAPLAVTLTQPTLTTAAAELAADQMARLASWTTYYVPGEGNYWGANISIPAHDVDQLMLLPGEWFDFWRDIGPVTVERGYGYGGVIIDGRSVANGALAGGICSTSTTLFNAAMRAGLEIGDRTNHSYYIERYPVGLDATVLKTDTWAVTMSFRNDTPDPIVIRSYTGSGWVRFDIWGVPTGRTVTLSQPVITDRRTARDTTVLNPDLKPGTAIRVEYPHNGFNASVTRTVRDASGEVIWQNTWFSHYNTVNGITEVGPEEDPKPDEGGQSSSSPG